MSSILVRLTLKMFFLEVCKRLKEELNQLLTEGEELMHEDEFLIELIASSKNLEGVLGFAK